MDPAGQGPWLRERYRRDRCTVLSPWSLSRQKWATWAEKAQKTQENAWVITRLFENSLSTAACSQAQIILNPLVSVSQGPLHICPLQDKADFQVLKPLAALPQPCKVSKAFGCPGRSLSLRILKQIYKLCDQNHHWVHGYSRQWGWRSLLLLRDGDRKLCRCITLQVWVSPEADRAVGWSFLLVIYILNPPRYLFPRSSFADHKKFLLMTLFLAPTAGRS